MNKEKYFMIREKEKEKTEMYNTIFKLQSFFKINEEYLNEFKSKDAKEALISIKAYIEFLSINAGLMDTEVNMLFNEYRRECKHEILLRGLNGHLLEPTGEYFCPLCRETFFKFDVIPQSEVVIDVPGLYAHDDPSYAKHLYLVMDYMIKNDIEWTQDNFDEILKKLVSKKVIDFCQLKDAYKVRRKV